MAFMSDQENGEKGVFFHHTGYMGADGEGSLTGRAIPIGDTSMEEAREMLADAHGVEPGDIAMGDEEMRRTASGRISVGFSKWRSSWDPDKERAERGDPSMN